MPADEIMSLRAESLRYRNRALEAEKELAEISEGLCIWTYDAFNKYWMTGCDQLFGLTNIAPEQSGFEYCPFCSMKIVVEGNDEDEDRRKNNQAIA
jgi:hypothetical protein